MNEFHEQFPPRASRVHEVHGASAWSFILSACVNQNDKMICISRNNWGFPEYSLSKPSRFRFIFAPKQKSQLWCMEEALRSGTTPYVLCELGKHANFRDMRRLQLAAELGQSTGLLMISENAGSPVAETRWKCEPVYDPSDAMVTSHLQLWSLIKNKSGALGAWKVSFDDTTHRIALV